MMTKIFLFFTLTILECMASNLKVTNYCYIEDKNPYRYFATKTAYEHVRAQQMEHLNDPGCAPIYMWALVRHGTRLMQKTQYKDIDIKNKIITLRDEILSNHIEHKRGKLCKSDIEALKQWKYIWPAEMNGELSLQGEIEIMLLGERLRNQLKNLFLAPVEKFEVSTESRTVKSAFRFAEGLLSEKSINERRNIKLTENNPLLRILHSMQSTISFNEVTKNFNESEYMKQVIYEVQDRLGFLKLSFEDMKLLYDFCAFESSCNANYKSSICAAFTPEHLKIMEYAEDIAYYYSIGYGAQWNAKLTNPIAQELFKKLNEAANTEKPSKIASINFGHTRAIMPLIKILGLYNGDKPLTVENYEELKNNREWKTSFIDPMASNILVVLYRCGTNHKVLLYTNEHLRTFSHCQSDVCTLEELYEKYRKDFED